MTADDFEARFGELIGALRAGTLPNALADAAAALAAAGPVRYETGFELAHEGLEGKVLKSRCLARMVDVIELQPGVTVDVLLDLAQALASDTLPITEGAGLRLEYTPLLHGHTMELSATGLGGEAMPSGPQRTKAERRAVRERRQAVRPWPGTERRSGLDRRTGERRAEAARARRALAVDLEARLASAIERHDTPLVLAIATELAELLPLLGRDDRRASTLQLRRTLAKPVLLALADLGTRDEVEQLPVLRLFRWVGLDAADVMLDLLTQGETLGPRRFLADGLAAMPESAPMLVALLRQGAWHEVRLAADLLGRMGGGRGTEALAPHLQHADPRARAAVAQALGQLKAAHLAGALLDVLRAETDPVAWRAMTGALGAIGGREAVEGLTGVALHKKPLFGSGGYPVERRVECVQALVAARTPGARAALQKLAREADGAVRDAARAAVGV